LHVVPESKLFVVPESKSRVVPESRVKILAKKREQLSNARTLRKLSGNCTCWETVQEEVDEYEQTNLLRKVQLF
jgi:hypothetical protein